MSSHTRGPLGRAPSASRACAAGLPAAIMAIPATTVWRLTPWPSHMQTPHRIVASPTPRRAAPRLGYHFHSLAHSIDLAFHFLDALVEFLQDLGALAAIVIALGRDLARRLGDAEDLAGRGADRADALRIGGVVDHPLDQLLELVLLVVAVVGARALPGGDKSKRGDQRRYVHDGPEAHGAIPLWAATLAAPGPDGQLSRGARAHAMRGAAVRPPGAGAFHSIAVDRRDRL